jgi:hypothetical protein
MAPVSVAVLFFIRRDDARQRQLEDAVTKGEYAFIVAVLMMTIVATWLLVGNLPHGAI